MNRPYVREVRANLKGAIDCTLGPKTLIVGPTGSGKSSVVNAVELALTGHASDIQGREEVAKEGILMSMAQKGIGTLFAEVTLSDGTKARWETASAGRGSAKRATVLRDPSINPDAVMPLREVRKMVASEPDTARRYFLKKVAGKVTDEDVLAHIPEPLRGHFKSLVAACPSDSTALDRLLHAAEKAGDRLNEARAGAKAAKATAAASSQGLAAPATEAQIATARARAAEALKAHEAAVAVHARLDASNSAQQQRATYAVEVGQHRDIIASLEGSLQTSLRSLQAAQQARATLGDATQNGVNPAQQALVLVLQEHADGRYGRGTECVVCGNATVAPGTFQVRRDYLKNLLVQREEYMKKVAAADLAVAQAQAEYDAVKLKLDAEKSGLAAIENILGQLDLRMKDAPAVLPDLNVTKKALSEANGEVESLTGRMAAWESANRARDKGAADEQEEAKWKQVKEACAGAVEKLLDLHVESLKARVQSRLPAGTVFGLQLRDGNHPCFRVGFVRDGFVVTALSGGEWAQMMAALADACAADTGPAVIVPEDRQMDPATLSRVLEALGSADGQIIVASVVHPTTVPTGWTVIDTVRGHHRSNAVVAPVTVPQPIQVTPPPAPAAIEGLTPVVSPGAVAAELADLEADLKALRGEDPATPAQVLPAPAPAAAAPAAAPEAPAKAKKPSKPRKKKDESDADYAKRMAEWLKATGQVPQTLGDAAQTVTGTVPVQPAAPAIPAGLCCPACDTELTPENSSRLGNGNYVHVGCKVKPLGGVQRGVKPPAEPAAPSMAGLDEVMGVPKTTEPVLAAQAVTPEGKTLRIYDES